MIEKFWKSAIMNVRKFTSKSLNHHKIPKRATRHHSQYPRRKGMKTMLRSMMIVCMLSAVLTVSPVPASAQVEEAQGSMPEGLQEAILSSTSRPFQEGEGIYSISSNGLDFELNVTGLHAGAEELQWGIALQGIGRGTQIMAVSAPKVSEVRGRLEYQRGTLTEWYRDTALGVEQGFTMYESPMGEDHLVLQLNLATDLEGVLDENGRGLSFPGPEGQTLRYDHLKVYDANGAELDARMVYEPGQVQILVDDSGAVYPITIDPLIYLEQKVIASDGGSNDYFGQSVALSGNTALVGATSHDVGANTDQGSVYVFVRSGITWTQQAQLTASDGTLDDYFGISVALEGNTALVGASSDDVGSNTDQGSVYVFVRNENTWTQEAHLVAADGASSDRFGYPVALSGDTALVGSTGDDVGANTDQGSAYVFVRSGTNWSQQAQLTASDGVSYDNFGVVALSDNTALVGAEWDDVGLNQDQGSAYVFVRSGITWTQQAQLIASNGEAFDHFGSAVALDGDRAVVGAPQKDVPMFPVLLDAGAAYFFTRSGTNWNQSGMPHEGGASGEYFGYSVGLDGESAIVGSPSFSLASGGHIRICFYYDYAGMVGWGCARVNASDSVTGDQFGYSVAVSGDMALAGANWDDLGGNNFEGSAYFYQGYYPDADLAVSVVRGTSDSISPGDTILLTVSVLNYGPSTAWPLHLRVALPPGLIYVSHKATFGTYTPSQNWWTVYELIKGVSARLTIRATVDAIPSQTLVFTPYLMSNDIYSSNNSASLSLPVYAPHEIVLNGGFNTFVGTSKIPQSWVAKNFSAIDGKITTVKKEGTASVKISNTAAVSKTLTQTLNLSGNSGDEFGFSFWARGTSIPVVGICRAQVFLYNGAVVITTKTVNCSTGTYGFTQKNLNFISPGAYTKVVIKLTYAKATGTIYFDGLSLMRAP
jgi:uncharacterized repeat protein (TIGR01451 family)